jgi:branched-chain amino acid transport system ATP-binding protein
VPDDRALLFGLTVRENLRLAARGTKKNDPRTSALTPEHVLTLFPPLLDKIELPAGLLSGGEQQMLALAKAFARRPRLLMIDEMSLGLAPTIVRALLPVTRSVADDIGAGVLVVEQHADVVVRMTDRAYVMSRGRIVAHEKAQYFAENPDVLEASYLGDV